jgi:beta-N-acetylhexosaminidase
MSSYRNQLAGGLALCLCVTTLSGGCTPKLTPPGSAPTPRPTVATGHLSSPSRPAHHSSTTLRPNPTPSITVDSVFDRLDREQRVGQLFMVGTSAMNLDHYTLSLVRQGLVGSVILTGGSYRGVVATAQVTGALQKAAREAGPPVPGLFIATDQEGGKVQGLRGPGFEVLPSALQQGSTPTRKLHDDAARWGGQLRAAGVNLDLAPVLDTVADRSHPHNNGPVGHYDREFGFDPETVSIKGRAVIAGLASSGVWSSAKHFPGLGRVRLNPDSYSGVQDTETSSTDPFLGPFRDAIRQGVPFVMMSTAVYARIDGSGPAAFSHIVVSDLLRNRLGFSGVVISDDLGNAAQVQSYPLGNRAVRFLSAGGDMVLTVNSDQVRAMRAAVLARMSTDAQFTRQVAAAVKRVLRAKLAYGLQ